jgi:hypothetical protein
MSEETQNKFTASGLFVKSAKVWRPMKIGFEGWAKAGKSTTMAKVVLGTWIKEGRKGNAVLQDTEDAGLFYNRIFEPEGLIEGKNFFITPSRSLTDFVKILKMCDEDRAIMMVDSTAHLYENMSKVYLEANKRSKILPQDHMVLKPKWKELFADPYVRAQCHALFTGRAAWEYQMEENEETGKKEFYKSGVKMKGDNETAYEADVLVLMERMQELNRDGIKVWRRGTIIGDRSGLLDGKQFDDPTFADFEPYYDFLCSSTGKKEAFKEGSMEGALNVSRDREWMENRQRAERYFEEIEGLFRSYLPGVGPKEKKVQADIFHTVFDTRSASAIGAMRAEDLDAGRRAIEYLLQKLIEQGPWLAKMQEDKSQSFNLADYIKQQHQEYLKPKKAQENDDIPFFQTPNRKGQLNKGGAEAGA